MPGHIQASPPAIQNCLQRATPDAMLLNRCPQALLRNRKTHRRRPKGGRHRHAPQPAKEPTVSRTHRREFLKTTTIAGAGYWIAGNTGMAKSKSPNEKLNIAVVGCGGKGSSDTEGVSSENIVAV